MKIFSLFSILLLFVACTNNQKKQVEYRLSEKDLIPEGITYSSSTNSFYISSLHKKKIVKLNAKTKELSDFIPAELIDLKFLGMIVDESTKQLWSCAFIAKESQYFSSILKFDLNSSELIKTYSLSDTTKHLFNDLVQDKKGTIYFTDTFNQTIYTINSKIDTIDIFFDSPEISYPNGISISPDNNYLYVASTNNGVRVIDIEDKLIVGEKNTSVDSKGIDGLKYYKNSLIGIQNDVKQKSDVKIARYFLDQNGSSITHMEIIDQDNALFNIPTTFAIVKNSIYCLANSQMANLSSDGTIKNKEALEDVMIIKYSLN